METQRLCRRVVLFGIDGGGVFIEKAQTPNIDAIAARGRVCHRALTELPSISAECWGSMLHGVSCQAHQLTNWRVSHNPYPADSPYPSVFRLIHEARPAAGLASFCEWAAINTGIIEDGCGVEKFSGSADDLTERAVRYIMETDFQMIFFQFDAADGVGHRCGYGTPAQLDAIARIDALIGRMTGVLKAKGVLEETLVMVTADHGGTRARFNADMGGNHGGDSDEEKYVYFAAAGGGVCRGEIADMMTRDVAPIAARALGLEAPECWTGRVPRGFFPNDGDERPRPVETGAAGETVWREETGDFLQCFSALRPLVYRSFEEAESAPEGTRVYGKLYRVRGVRGAGMCFEDGCLSMKTPALKAGFSLMLWIKLLTDEKVSAPIADIQDADGRSVMTLALSPYGNCSQYLTLTLAPEERRSMDSLILVQRPRTMTGRWTHLCVSVDALCGRVEIAFNFGEHTLTLDVPQARGWASGEGTITLAGARDGARGEGLPAVMDDFCLCAGRPDAAGLKALGAYYGADGRLRDDKETD